MQRGRQRAHRQRVHRRPLRGRGILFLRDLSGLPRWQNQVLQKARSPRRPSRRWPRPTDDRKGKQTEPGQRTDRGLGLPSGAARARGGQRRTCGHQTWRAHRDLWHGPDWASRADFRQGAGANPLCVHQQTERLPFGCETMRLGKTVQTDANQAENLQA